MAYCAVTDLVIGNIPTPAYLDLEKIVQDAADEMDMVLGQRYVTPINASETALPIEIRIPRPASLMLKRINATLASGRLLLAVASPEENRNLHAYAWSLVQEAKQALESIRVGDVVIQNAPVLENTNDGQNSGPWIANKDAESNVDAFYDRLANPAYSFGEPFPARRAHDGFGY